MTSINIQINRIKQNIADTYDILETKEVEVPAIQNSDALDEAAQAIYHNLHCINLHSPEEITLNLDEYNIIDITELTATGEIVNQDIIVTENGTYTADKPYTGLGAVTVDVETYEDIAQNYENILNRIKVVLNENNVEAPESYEELPDVITMVIQMSDTV